MYLVQIVIGLLLTGLILLQAKGVGLGRTVLGGAYHSRRGLEKIVFRLTILTSIIFVLTAIWSQFL